MSEWMRRFIEKKLAEKKQLAEGKFLIPEEIPTAERTAFMGAAAAAHKAGKSHFNFGGKKHAVTMKKDTAKAINDDVEEAYSEPQGQAKRMMSPLQKARMDKEKRDRDANGKLKSRRGRSTMSRLNDIQNKANAMAAKPRKEEVELDEIDESAATSAASAKKMRDMADKRRRDQEAAKKKSGSATPSTSKKETPAERKARRHQQDQADFSKTAARHREEAAKHETIARDHDKKTKGITGKLFGGKHKEAVKLNTAAAKAHHKAAEAADKVHKAAGGKKTSYSSQTDYHKHGDAARQAARDAHSHGVAIREEVEEGYVSMAQQRAVWATRKDGGKGHPDNKKKSKKEETVSEISMTKLSKYAKAASKDIDQKRNKVKAALDQPASVKHAKAGMKAMQGLTKRSRGSDMYVNKMTGRSKVKPTNEDNIEEISKKTLGNYVKKASKDAASKAAYGTQLSRDGDTKKGGKMAAKAYRRTKNIGKAADRLAKEAYEGVPKAQHKGYQDPQGKGLSPSAKAQLANKTPMPEPLDEPKVDAKNFADFRKSLKVSPKRPGDNAKGDKAPKK